MPIQYFGSTGAAGLSGATGLNATELATPSGDGGNGQDGGAGGDIAIVLTLDDLALATQFHAIGGRAGDAGGGGYSGQLFQQHDEERIGDFVYQNDYFSGAGAGGDGGIGGAGGNSHLTASGLTFADGVTLIANATAGGYGGMGGNGGAGATDTHNTEAAWDSYVDEDLVQHIVSRDYTSHGAPGGAGGHGGAGGNAGTSHLDFSGNTVHQNVWLVAQGGNGGFGWGGGGGGAGNDPAIGGVGGKGGDGGDGHLTVDGNHFDFASSVTMTAWGGMGGIGGVGGSGGYGLTAEGVEGVYDIAYTYAMGAVGGNGGDGGGGQSIITNNLFIGGDIGEKLNLSIHLNAAAGGWGGQGGVGAFENKAYDAADGWAGAAGTSSLVFDGNVLDGEGGVDTLELLMWSLSADDAGEGTSASNLPALSINLATGTMMVGNGVNAIDDIENVAVSYANGYYDAKNNLRTHGDVVLIGSAADNQLSTTTGNDYIDGGEGADTMSGGLGQDVYVVDSKADRIVEARFAGTDTVHAWISWSLAGQYIENAELKGQDALNLQGNSFDNSLTGNAGDNRINGAQGADTMSGGAGNDIYFVDNAGDTVWEGAAEGWDTVNAWVTFTLGDDVEALTLSGYQAINGTGNAVANTLVGNNAANSLNGGEGDDTIQGSGGNDWLTGGAGSDTFVFSHFGQPNGLDTVADFVSGTDHLMFTASDFGFSAGHVLTGAEFNLDHRSGTGGQFIFNSLNHRLYWDADGTGGGAAVTIAILTNVATISANDFIFG